jgi:hypothetical protein
MQIFGYKIIIEKVKKESDKFFPLKRAVQNHFGEKVFSTTDEKIQVIKFLRAPAISKLVFSILSVPESEIRGNVGEAPYIGLAYAKELAEYLFFDEMKSNNWFLK